MKNTNEISIVKDDKRNYYSPKKSTQNSKTTKPEQNKKHSKTTKKTKKEEKYQNKKQILLLQKEHINNKMEYPIVIHTSQNFTPNKRKYIQFRLSETQSKRKEKNIHNIKENDNRNNYLTKGNKLIYKSNRKPRTSNNINTLILNFKKDVPSWGNQNRIQSINQKKSHNENNSYILSKKRSLFKANNINDTNKKNNINNDNYTIKIGKNKNNSPKKKEKR